MLGAFHRDERVICKVGSSAPPTRRRACYVKRGAPPPKLARSGDQSQRNLPREAALVEPLDNG